MRDTSDNVLRTLHTQSIATDGAPFTDLGYDRRIFDLGALSGQTVRIAFRQMIPESFAGPALLEIDDVRLVSEAAQVRIPDVDEYTVDLAGRSGPTPGS